MSLTRTGPEAKLNPDDERPGISAVVAAPDDTELTEHRMRRALGLDGGGASRTLTIKDTPAWPAAARTAASEPLPQRSRAAERTSTRVDTASPLRQHVAELEDKLATERQRHEEARRLLHQAGLTVRALEARSQHEAAAQQDELDAARRAIVTAQRTLDDTVFEIQQRDRDRQSAKKGLQSADPAAASRSVAEAAVTPALRAIACPPPVGETPPPKKRGRPRTRQVPEPKPVRWWTPSYQAKTKG